MSDICKCHLQFFSPEFRSAVKYLSKHAATTAAITNEETEILEQLTAVTETCKEEAIDRKDQELSDLIERRKKRMETRPK